MNNPFNPDEITYRTIVQNMPGLVLVLDAEWRIVEISNAYARATMIRRDEVLGRSMFNVFPDNPDDPSSDGVHNLRTSLERVMKSGVPDTMAVQKYDVRKLPEDGGGFEERY